MTGSLASLGAAIGEALAGPGGVLPGAAIGSMFGFGGSASVIPSTGTVYFGPVLSFSPGLSGGTGFTITSYFFPPGQDPNGVLGGWSGSITYQPAPWAGSTVTKSPGQAPVVGVSFGTKVPFSVGGGYSFCVRNCPK